jgi:hypothetical protein
LAIPDVLAAQFRQWLALFEATQTDLCTAGQAALFLSRAEQIATSFQMVTPQQNGEVPVLCPIRQTEVQHSTDPIGSDAP